MQSSFRSLKDDFSNGLISKAEYIQSAHQHFHSHLFAYSFDICKTDIASIEISDNCVLMTSRNDRILIEVDPSDFRTAPIEILNFNEYEPNEMSIVRLLSPHIDTMLDIGANVGWYSLVIGSLNKSACIHSFEPIPDTFARLEKNCLLNKCVNINCHNYGLSSAPGSFPFYFYPEGGINASMRNLSGREDAVVVQCQLSTLDQFSLQYLANSRCDFVKCDVEGNELSVLEGGNSFLTQHKPILFLELLRKWSAQFGYHPNDVFKLLKDIGYSAYVVESEGKLVTIEKVDDNTTETNFFFVHPESRLRSFLVLL